jgi:hypothetical protein
MVDYSASETEVRRLRRVVKHLQNELNESQSPENNKVRQVCDYHSDLWKQAFPRARGLKYPMTGKNATAVRTALRWKFSVQDLKRVLDGAFASDFHRGNTKYLYLESILRDENRIRNHLERADKEKGPQLWPPMDRVLHALRARGLKWDRAYLGEQEEGRVWRHSGECPLCHGRLRVGTRDNGYASVRCEKGCEFFEVLRALDVDPAELARPFDPGEVEALESALSPTAGGVTASEPRIRAGATSSRASGPPLGATELFERQAA